jgi:hypothetical protein
MDIEARLRVQEARNRQALSASVAAKTHYLALLDDPRSIRPPSNDHGNSGRTSAHANGESLRAWVTLRTLNKT